MDKILLDSNAIKRALTRISYEIIEKNKGVENIILLGIKTRGVPLGKHVVEKIFELENVAIPFGVLDITFYRDDLEKSFNNPVLNNRLDVEVEDKIVILVDDVIYTGRTLRSAIDAVIDEGRPKKIQFATLIDRGHRELPLSPDYVGKNIPTAQNEIVRVNLKEIDGVDQVQLISK